jgi:hypothetical protein
MIILLGVVYKHFDKDYHNITTESMVDCFLFETSSDMNNFLVGLGFKLSVELPSYKLDKETIKSLIYDKESESGVFYNFIAKILGYSSWEELQSLGKNYNNHLEKGLVSKLEDLVNNRDVYIYASIINNLTLYQKR